MDGYEIHFDEASQGASRLEQLVEDLRTQIQAIESTEQECLNDSLWYGLNKQTFMERLDAYKKDVAKLLESAEDHHSKLVEILNAYSAAES